MLDDLQAQISAIYDADNGGTSQIIPTVNNGTYENGVLTYAGGELRPGLPAAGVIINGLARLEFAGDTQDTYVTCSNSSTGFEELFQSNSATRPRLLAAIDAADNGTVAIGWATESDSGSTVVTVGTDPFTVEFLVDRVVLTVNGVEHVSPVCPVPLTTPYTKLLALTSAEVSFFTSSSAATGLLPDETAARIAGDAALQDQIDDVQAQASANAAGVAANAELLGPVPRKIDPSWYMSGSWYDVEYPRYVSVNPGTIALELTTFVPRQVLENATFTALAFYCSTAAAGAVAYAGIYSDNAGQPGSLLASISADCSTTGVKSDSISLTLSAGQIVWDAFLLTGGAAQVYRYNVTRALQEQTLGPDSNSVTYRYTAGQTGLTATAPATTAAQATQIPRLMLQRA